MTRERLLAGLPVRQRRVDAAGVATALLEGGAGPPLFLLHGGIECGGVYWAPVIARLAVNHRVLVPDAPGLCESASFDRLDDEHFAGWLHELIDRTCEARPTLGAFPLRDPGGTFRRARRRTCAARGRARHRPLSHAARAVRALLEIGTVRVPDAELRRIAIPVALLWGRYDRMTPPALARAASMRLGWPLQVVDEAAHVPHLEQPDSFVDRLTTAAPLSAQEAVG